MMLYDLLRGIECTIAPPNKEIAHVTTDSRQIKENTMFVCIQGENSDGHNYAKQAVEKGAVAVVCQRDVGIDGQIMVENSRAAYSLICANLFGNPARKLSLIGVTGTNGKTTVSSLIKHVLEGLGQQVGLLGTIQTEIGDMVIPAKHTTPDPMVLHSTLARMVRAGCRYVAMEVSSHGMAQYRLEGCHFASGVFTNLTQDHLDYHGDMESYYQAKRSLFDRCDRAVINIDDEAGRRILGEIFCAVTTFSTQSDIADYSARDITLTALGSDFSLNGIGESAKIQLGMPGEFSVSNAMAVVACCVGLGFDLQEVAAGLSACPGITGRAEVIHRDEIGMIIRDYAHTPDGLEKILSALRPFAKGRLVTLFGCPGNRDATKRPQMARAVAEGSDFVILSSDNPRHEDPDDIIAQTLPAILESGSPHIVIVNRYQAILWALKNRRQDDLLLLAGKGHEDYQVLGAETIYFDEKIIVQEALGSGAI